MAGTPQAEKAGYPLDMEGFWLSDKCRGIAVSYTLLKEAPKIYFIDLTPRSSGEKRKGCPLVDFPLSPDPAAMTLDNALDYGQANTGAFVFISTVQSLEDAEDFISITLSKPNAVVLNVIDGFASLSLAA